MIAIIKTKVHLSTKFRTNFSFFPCTIDPSSKKLQIFYYSSTSTYTYELQFTNIQTTIYLTQSRKTYSKSRLHASKDGGSPSFRIITGARFSIAESGRISYGALLHHHHVPFKRESARKSSSTTLTSLYRPYTGPVVYRLCMHGANLVPFGRAHSLQTEVPTLWSVVTQA